MFLYILAILIFIVLLYFCVKDFVTFITEDEPIIVMIVIKTIGLVWAGTLLFSKYGYWNEINSYQYEYVSGLKDKCNKYGKCRDIYKSIIKDNKITGFEFEEFKDELYNINEENEKKELLIEQNKKEKDEKEKIALIKKVL